MICGSAPTDQFCFNIGILGIMVVVFTIVLRICVSNAVAKMRRHS